MWRGHSPLEGFNLMHHGKTVVKSFEIAADPPGVMVDEALEGLGAR